MIESAHEHLALLELLRRREEAAATELMESHLNRAATFWSKHRSPV
jgi:DNA-binding FadR family transcriptional regulator